MKATRSLLIASICVGITSTTSCEVLPPCNVGPDVTSANPVFNDLWVGDTVRITATASSTNEFCQPSYASSDVAPSSYVFSIKDTTVATLSNVSEVIAVGAGVTSLTVRHKRGGHDGGASIRVARPVSEIRFVITPAAPVVGDTVDVVTQAIDQNGDVTPGAIFSGLYLVADYVPTSSSDPTRLLYAPDHVRWILRAPGSYRFNNSVMHLEEKAVTSQITIKIP